MEEIHHSLRYPNDPLKSFNIDHLCGLNEAPTHSRRKGSFLNGGTYLHRIHPALFISHHNNVF